MQEIAQGCVGVPSHRISVQLVTSDPFFAEPSTCKSRYRPYLRPFRRCSQSTVQRNHARYLLALHGKRGPPVEADIQGAHVCPLLSSPSSQDVAIGTTTLRIPSQEWKRACRRRCSLSHLYREDVEKLLLRRRQGQRSGHQQFVGSVFD